MKPAYTLGRQERLKSRKVLEQLFRDGQTLYVHPVKLYYTTTGLPADITLQAGFGVPSRIFKKAVERNRIKRLMREGYRLQKCGLQATIESTNLKLALFFLYTAKEQPTFELVKEKIGTILEKLEKTIPPSPRLRRAKPND